MTNLKERKNHCVETKQTFRKIHPSSRPQNPRDFINQKTDFRNTRQPAVTRKNIALYLLYTKPLSPFPTRNKKKAKNFIHVQRTKRQLWDDFRRSLGGIPARRQVSALLLLRCARRPIFHRTARLARLFV